MILFIGSLEYGIGYIAVKEQTTLGLGLPFNLKDVEISLIKWLPAGQIIAVSWVK